MFKLRKEKMEKIKNVLLQTCSYLLMAIEWLVKSSDKGCKVKKSEQLQLFSTLVIFRFVSLNSCTPRQLGLPVRKTESSGLAVFT